MTKRSERTANRAHKLFLEALAEDKRESGAFDRDGWSNYFEEVSKTHGGLEAVQDAWTLYERHHYDRH